MSRPAIPREGRADSDDVVRFGPFELNASRFELRRDGRLLHLEPRTFDLLMLLARNVGRTVTRDEIFAKVWHGRIVSDAALSSQVRSARRALGDTGDAQQIIATVHGRGFRLCEAIAAPHEAASDQPGPPTVVVQSFASLDGDGRGTVLAHGITEDVVTALSKNRWLRVIPQSAVVGLATAGDDPGAMARGIRADYVVTGSVRGDGHRARITVQALSAGDLRCLWSEGFDRDMRDIFDLQDEISRLITARLATELGITEQQRAARQHRDNRGAWELYQLGSVEFCRFTSVSNRRCQRLMRQAIREDAGFSSAYARLAYAMILEMVYFDGARDRGRMDEALDLALRGVACDDQDANTLFAVGRVRLARCEYDLAIDALEEALRLNPCLAVTYCGLGDSLAYEGRLDEAIDRFQTAIDLSPHDPFRWAFMSYRALAHIFGGDFEDAAKWARRATQVPNAHFWANAHLVSALGNLGARSDAADAVEGLKKVRPDFTRRFAEDRLFYVKSPRQLGLFLEGLQRAGVE